MITNDQEKENKSPAGGIRNNAGKLNFFLIPQLFNRRLAQWFTDGAIKYSRGNWKKGQPLHWYVESLFRHLDKLIEGDDSEDHLAALAWNVCAFMWTEDQLKKDRLPHYLWTVGSGKKYDPDYFEEWYDEWKETGIDFIRWNVSNNLRSNDLINKREIESLDIKTLYKNEPHME